MTGPRMCRYQCRFGCRVLVDNASSEPVCTACPEWLASGGSVRLHRRLVALLQPFNGKEPLDARNTRRSFPTHPRHHVPGWIP